MKGLPLVTEQAHEVDELADSRIGLGMQDIAQQRSYTKGIGKRIWRRMLRATRLEHLHDLARHGALAHTGWLRSAREQKSVDRDGSPIPWLTYPAIALLETRIKPEFEVFEYGSGGSTLWWAKRVNRIVSCEHDESWGNQVRPRLPGNAELVLVSLEQGAAYSQAAVKTGKSFDILIIDGRDRVRCAQTWSDVLKDTGVIIWDNTDRPRYQQGIRELRDAGFKQVPLVGLAPISWALSETSILYRPNNCLGL